MPQDDTTVERLKQGDAEALGEFITGHRSQLLGFIRSLCSDRLLAVVEIDDLLQDVSLSAASSLGTAPLDHYAPLEWLQQVARRRIVDAHRFHFEAQRRDAKRQQAIHGDGQNSGQGLEALIAANVTSPSAALSRDVRSQRIAHAIQELPEDHRQVLQLRYFQNLPTKEIASQMGKSDGSIRVLLSRILRSLEGALEDVRPSRD